MLAAPLALALLVAAAPPTELPPGLIAYEPFDLPPGTYVLGSDRGAGWDGPWFAPRVAPYFPDKRNFPRRADHLLVMADSLAAPGAAGAGGSASAVALPGRRLGVLSRKLADPRSRPGQVTYISVLVKAEGVLNSGTLDGCVGVRLEQRFAAEKRYFAGQYVTFGKPYGIDIAPGYSPQAREWCLSGDLTVEAVRVAQAVVNPLVSLRKHGGGRSARSTEQQLTSGIQVTPGRTTRLVLRVESAATGGKALFSLAVDPDPTRPEPPPAAALLEGWSGINDPSLIETRLTILSGGAFTIDEIRVAGTFAAAVGAPPEAD